MNSQKNHTVLLIGSGMMTPPLVDYLVKFKDTRITVASNIIEDAKKIASRHPSYMDAVYLDVFNVSVIALKDHSFDTLRFVLKGSRS